MLAAVDKDSDGEDLVVIRALLILNHIDRAGLVLTLAEFQQQAFEILVLGLLQQGGESGYDMPVDHLAGRFESAIQVHRSNQGLDRVGENGIARPPPGTLLGIIEQQILAQIEIAADAAEIDPVDEKGFVIGQHPLLLIREFGVEILGHHQSEDRIAEKLETFIGLQAVFAGMNKIGTMFEGLDQQGLIMEAVVDDAHQLFELRRFNFAARFEKLGPGDFQPLHRFSSKWQFRRVAAGLFRRKE